MDTSSQTLCLCSIYTKFFTHGHEPKDCIIWLFAQIALFYLYTRLMNNFILTLKYVIFTVFVIVFINIE